MILYIESNFVLEIAFLREEHQHCETLLALAESAEIHLAIPAFAVGEPYEAWVRRAKRRRELYEKLSVEIHELSRSKPYRKSSEELRELTNLLITSGEEEKRRLDETLGRIINAAEVIPIDRNVLRAAIELQVSRSLSPQDSIVYASVLHHLEHGTDDLKCFVTKNSKDFLNPDIENELTSQRCKLLTKFGDGLGYIRRQLSKA